MTPRRLDLMKGLFVSEIFFDWLLWNVFPMDDYVVLNEYNVSSDDHFCSCIVPQFPSPTTTWPRRAL